MTKPSFFVAAAWKGRPTFLLWCPRPTCLEKGPQGQQGQKGQKGQKGHKVHAIPLFSFVSGCSKASRATAPQEGSLERPPHFSPALPDGRATAYLALASCVPLCLYAVARPSGRATAPQNALGEPPEGGATNRTLHLASCSSFIPHPSSFIIRHSSFVIHHSSFILHPSSFISASLKCSPCFVCRSSRRRARPSPGEPRSGQAGRSRKHNPDRCNGGRDRSTQAASDRTSQARWG